MSLRHARLMPLGVAALYAAVMSLPYAGTVAAVFMASSAVFAGGLALVLRRSASVEERALVRRMALGALLTAPALLTLYFSFRSGGFLPDSIAFAGVLVAAIGVARLALADDPLAGWGRIAAIPGVALAAFVGWALLSGSWSDAPGRAVIEADRALLYLLVFLLFASVGRTAAGLRKATRRLAFVMLLVAAVALLSRVAPDVFDTAVGLDPKRLSYPLMYWNALGAFCAIGGLLCFHLTASLDEKPAVRVIAAAGLPVFGATLLFTFSRGGIATAALAAIVYVVAGYPRGLAMALAATAVPTIVAVRAAYDATLLASTDPRTPAAIAQGHHVGKVVVACAAGAAIIRLVLLLADRWASGVRLQSPHRRQILAGAWIAAFLTAAALAVAFHVPGFIGDRYDDFVNQSSVPASALTRGRLTSTSNQGRIRQWDVALKGLDANPLTGSGAGTYPLLWYEHRETTIQVVDAHSLWIETLGELGIIGFVLLLVAVGGILVAVAPVRRGGERATYAALFAAGVAWAAHAGLDWDWEMPALTLWLFALGGLACARSAEAGTASPRRPIHPLVLAGVGAGFLIVSLLPALVLTSQKRLSGSVDAYASGNCGIAVTEARRASDALGWRSEPHEIIGLCAASRKDYGGAAVALRDALDRDPNSAALHLDMAVVLAAAGEDAAAELARARQLNPREPTVFEWTTLLSNRDPATRRRNARQLASSLPLAGRY